MEGTNKVEACASSTEGGTICEEHESSTCETILMVGGPMIVPHSCIRTSGSNALEKQVHA